MKKLLVAIAMVALGFNANAQEKGSNSSGFDNGDIYISGTVGFGSSSSGDVSESAFTLAPSVGYFVNENIALELGLMYGSTSDEFSDRDTNMFGASLGGVYYFTPQNDFSFVLGAAFSYANASTETAGVEGPDRTTFGFAVAPGVNYFVSESIALRASIGALSYTNTSVEGSDNSQSNFGIALDATNINFGMTYKF